MAYASLVSRIHNLCLSDVMVRGGDRHKRTFGSCGGSAPQRSELAGDPRQLASLADAPGR